MYTKNDIMQMVEDEDVEFIRLQFTDIFGNMKMLPLQAASWKKRWITVACSTVHPLRDL